MPQCCNFTLPPEISKSLVNEKYWLLHNVNLFNYFHILSVIHSNIYFLYTYFILIKEHKYHYLHSISIQLLLNLLCSGLDSANCYNKERVSLQYAVTAQQTSRYWDNIAPITFRIYVLYGQETCTYTIFNWPKGICTASQRSVFCWPVHDVL